MFVKGKTGNPGGRPKRTAEELQRWKAASEKNLAILENIRDNSCKDTDRLRAIEIIEERTYGRPVQAIEASIENEVRNVDTSKLTEDQKSALVDLALTQENDGL